MKIAITGSAGRIGGYVYKKALAGGHHPLGIDITPPKTPQRFILADAADFGAITDALQGSDAVIHLGAIPDSRIMSASKTFSSNMAGTYNVYEACRMLGIKRIVFASSIQAVRTAPALHPTAYRYFPLDEQHERDPQSDYALSKALGEDIGATYARHFGITAVSLRFMWVSSEEDFSTLSGSPPVPEHPALYSYCDVRDTARACVLAATVPLPDNSHTTAFITAKDTWLDMPSADFVRAHFPDAEDRGLRNFDSLLSGETARRVFGFVPEFSWRDRLRG